MLYADGWQLLSAVYIFVFPQGHPVTLGTLAGRNVCEKKKSSLPAFSVQRSAVDDLNSLSEKGGP